MHVGRWIRGSSVAALVAAVALIAPRPAAADPGSYRGPVVAADLGAYALFGTGVGLENPLIAYAAVFAYALGGPSVHVAHGNWGRAGISLGTRVGAPIVLGIVGCKLGQSASRPGIGRSVGCFIAGVTGAAVGMLGAQIVDWSVLAGGYEDTTPQMFTLGGAF